MRFVVVAQKNETLSKLTEESFGVLTSNIDPKFLKAFGGNVIKQLGELITTSGSDYISIKPAVGAVAIDQFTSDVPDILNKAKDCCDEAWKNDANEIVIYKTQRCSNGRARKR